MKRWFRNCGILAGILTVAVWLVVNPPEPDRCCICGHIKSHAPCLVNLSTGAVGELSLYSPHPELVGELAEEQPGGVLGYYYAAGCRVTKISGLWEVTTEIPVSKAGIRKIHFCRNCRKLLRGQHTGYVLADLYEAGKPVIYSIADGVQYQIRCYTVSLEKQDGGETYTLKMIGMLDR